MDLVEQHRIKFVKITIQRRQSQDSDQYTQTFMVPYKEKMNVISALMEVRKNPITVEGKQVEPPAWEAACLEEVCGSCTMLINGKVRQACTALIENIADIESDCYVISLAPMSKFPVVRDLIVDRSKMFENLKKVKAWVPIDGSFDLGMAAPQDDHIRQLRYALSRCMSCGCCLEACPQINEKSSFVGPAAIGQALLFNLHPVGNQLTNDRMEFLTSEDGITGCGNAQNCVKVCPKGVPLTDAIATLNRDSTIFTIKKWIGMV